VKTLLAAVLLLPWYVRRHGWGRREWLLLTWIVPPGPTVNAAVAPPYRVKMLVPRTVVPLAVPPE